MPGRIIDKQEGRRVSHSTHFEKEHHRLSAVSSIPTMLPYYISLFSLLFSAVSGGTTPMFKYLKELCPPGLLPLTGTKHVRTCKDLCPLDAQCIQGICCVKPPVCLDLSYKYPTNYACLPPIKQNCPAASRCVPSDRIGMSVCCSVRKPPASREPLTEDHGVCPASHPVISHENNQIRLCSSCHDGVCVAFRKSDVSVCCQSFSALCGPNSAVEMDGLLARDCTKNLCSPGFECSLATSGSRICCSLAICSSGVRARAVCAGGCRKNEQCEELDGQRWCCPKLETCPNKRKTNGKTCILSNQKCARGYECMESEEGRSWLCCEKTAPAPVRLITTTRKPFVIPETELEDPVCESGDYPLVEDDEYLPCPEEGAPCPRAGYICQTTTNNHMFCCPIPDGIETTTALMITRKPKGKQSLAKIFKEITAIPMVTVDPGSEAPRCLVGHVPARNNHNNEIKRCAGFLDFSCPFGFICQPSTTTAGFLCCAKISKTMLL